MAEHDIHEFDKTMLVGYFESRIDEIKAEHPDVYENHLQIAFQLEQWAEKGMNQDLAKRHLSPERIEGWKAALLEVRALLRQGDYAPGGGMLPAQNA